MTGRHWHLGNALLALALALGAAGCTDDYGTPCNFPQSPEVLQSCASTVESETSTTISTCVDNFNADCESRLCIQFEGNQAFCSHDCASDADCEAGSTCVEDENTSVGAFCVPDDLLSTDG